MVIFLDRVFASWAGAGYINSKTFLILEVFQENHQHKDSIINLTKQGLIDPKSNDIDTWLTCFCFIKTQHALLTFGR